jgi:hypothetical protein
MRNDIRLVMAVWALGALAGCAIDDSIAPTGSGGATAAGTGGKGSGGGATAATGGKGGTSTTLATGGKSGSGGTGVGGSNGGIGGTGLGGAAGIGGTAGAGGAGGVKEAGPDGTPSEAGPDVGTDAVADAAPEVEACAPETDDALCARFRKNCGSFVAVDNCGLARSVFICGRCTDDGAVCGSGGTLNLCPGSEPVNRAQGGSILSTNPTSPPSGALEGDTKAFDNDVATKWYVRGNQTPSIAYDFGAGRKFIITSYTLTSGNDQPDRDPLSWRLEGTNSQNLTGWVTLDTRMNETFALRGQTNLYSFANTTAYAVYRLTVTANNGNTLNGGEFQIAEIQFFGDPAPADASAPDAPAPDASGPDASAE